MNPVEIEEAVSNLALEPFDAAEFPFQFLIAFDNPATTIKRLRTGSTNQSDVPGGVLQRNNIHIATCAPGAVDDTLKALRDSPKTASAKAKFIVATDGAWFQAEDLNGGGTVACTYAEFPDHFGFFLPLAGITTVKEIRESSFDVKATGRLNKLYVQLLKENPDWASIERQHDMNHFMARLIFCFFAEDTDIFLTEGLFIKTVEQMSAGDAAMTHEVIGEIFRAMDTKPADREAADLPRYASKFPYVNGQLFSGSTEAPRFSKVARSYLMHIGSLNWRKINPDIFGSMIQAVTDEDERGSLGMHYTSVPNILKVLNPLFLDDLREKLVEAGDSPQKLLNLRKRMARIRVFDPACGSGNFLVIAYKAMREIEFEINKRRGEPDRRSDIPLTNFRGIELRDFPAEIARLALIIAEYQSDVTYRGQKEAIAEFLPLGAENWITCGNALRLDWLSVCPPTGTGVRVTSDDLFQTPLDQAEIDFENEGGETYICGNPPYKGRNKKEEDQKSDLFALLGSRTDKHKSLDYVAAWFVKLSDFMRYVPNAGGAFVATNSICQGEQVPILWPIVFSAGQRISFAHRSFRWANLASNNAGVTVVIVGLSSQDGPRFIYDDGQRKEVGVIGPYLAAGSDQVVQPLQKPIGDRPQMYIGNMAKDGGHLIFEQSEKKDLLGKHAVPSSLIKDFWGAQEVISGVPRCCLWLIDADLNLVLENDFVRSQVDKVAKFRRESKAPSTRDKAPISHRFVQLSPASGKTAIIIPAITSENRDYLPVTVASDGAVIGHKCYAIYDQPLWVMSLIASRLHWVWIGTVCARLELRFSYSNTMGWNTFPVPSLTQQNKADLIRCAENIVLAREAHFPATLGDLYEPNDMPEDLRRAHEANDELLERIYIGRRFRNDTERLEKLFELYSKMTTKPGGPTKVAA
ncbi:class I SAM-dependent DNA methyltransferase [Brevundimonas goettingensis]|uniref:site-specific DNA-methyltransferase (adenine-specific) n=2 Tax=Brevundimonas goettingensis TaxID=2774190 RepID=A0A975C6L5_9CAUL|nr:class I SAM-dependent DNA methyltransferase [Brevundimonas goettingensis]